MNYIEQQSALMTASLVLNEKWNLLILHQILNGSNRFNQIANALEFLSPTLISKRLKFLIQKKVVFKKNKLNGKGFEYYLSALGKRLSPLIIDLCQWGAYCQIQNMSPQELLIHQLIKDNLNMINVNELPTGLIIIRMHFNELYRENNWWLLVSNEGISLTIYEPPDKVDVYLTFKNHVVLKDLLANSTTIKKLIRNEDLVATGTELLIRNINCWFVSRFNTSSISSILI